MSYKVWDKITYPFSVFKGCALQVQEWIIDLIPQLTGHVITFVIKKGAPSISANICFVQNMFNTACAASGPFY